MKNIMLSLILISLIILPSCTEDKTSYTKVENNPVVLIDGMKSYQSIDTVKQAIEHAGYSWEVITDVKLDEKDRRPPFSFYQVRIKGYNHLGQSGSLDLTFFNNRLEETWFYPDHVSLYLQVLKKRKNIDLIKQEEVSISLNTRVWKHEDYRGLMYIAWEDTRLRDEADKWTGRYS